MANLYMDILQMRRGRKNKMEIAICNSHNFSITQPFVIFFPMLSFSFFFFFSLYLMKYECIFAFFTHFFVPFLSSSSIFESLPPTKFSSCFRKCPSNIIFHLHLPLFFFCCVYFIVWLYKRRDFIAIELPSGIDLYSSNILDEKRKERKCKLEKFLFYSVHIFYVSAHCKNIELLAKKFLFLCFRLRYFDLTGSDVDFQQMQICLRF